MSRNLIDPPALVRQAVDVAAELSQAATEHEAGQQAERASLEHYRKAGEALLRAKAAAGHGNWLKALKGQSRIPQQRASEYMRLAEGWSKLPPGGSFTLKDALGIIATADAGPTLDSGGGAPLEGFAESSLQAPALTWFQHIRESGFLLTEAWHRINEAGETIEGNARLDQIVEEVRRHHAEAISGYRIELLQHRDTVGDKEAEADVLWLLLRDPETVGDAIQTAERVMRKHFPRNEDVERVMDAHVHAVLKKLGVCECCSEGQQGQEADVT